MLTDKFNPEQPVQDRSNEIWIEVDARRAALAYAKGARDIAAAMGDIEHFAWSRHGDAVSPKPAPYGRLRRDRPVRFAKRTVVEATRMSQTLAAGAGLARMPESEVRAWLALEDGSMLQSLLTEERPAWPGDIPSELLKD